MNEIKMYAYHRDTNKLYWFDVMWGNHYPYGNGYIGMLPISVKERTYVPDNREPIDPTECDIFRSDDADEINLCSFCRNEIPLCNSDPQFGSGKGNDNVIECSSFE